MDPAALTFLAAGALGTAVVTAYRFWALGQAPALDRAWAEAARRIGGRALIAPATFWSGAARRIRFDVEGVAVTIDTFTEGGGRGNQHYTRLRAGPLPGLCRAQLGVAPRNVLEAIARRLGLGETPTGDEAFDAAFRVVSHPAGLGREMLDATLRELTLESEVGFEIEGKMLSVVCSGLPEESRPLIALAGYGRAIIERWVELADAPSAAWAALGLGAVGARVELESEGATTVARGARRGCEIGLSVLPDGGRYMTIVSVGVAGGGAFALDRRAPPAGGGGGVPADVRALAESAPPSLVRVVGEPGRVTLEFEGLKHDPNEIAWVVEALLEARHPGGAYR
ncbi:MAG TPA: hypothetical protein VFS43_01265 [Polyangiaceae bacterium]|nr:hypothetical protein [Polyangiaceae bacterium]